MKRIRILLRELSLLDKSEVSAVCEHCQRSPSEGIKCKRCEYIDKQLKCCNDQKRIGERDRRLGIWLSTIKELQELLSDPVIETNFEESKRILKELHSSIARSAPRISDLVDTLVRPPAPHKTPAPTIKPKFDVYKISKKSTVSEVPTRKGRIVDTVVRPPNNTPASTIKPNEPKLDVNKISKKTTVSKLPTQKRRIKPGRSEYSTESSRKKSVDEKTPKDPPNEKAIDKKSRKFLQNRLNTMRGIFTYQLSDKRFIKNGWTILPTMDTDREYGVYKVTPVKPLYDWTALNRCKGVVYYDTGEILAVFKDNGAVTWYYRNRMIALVYNGPEESEQCPSMYVLYSNKVNMQKKQSVLAKFDYCGKGVVYDHQGNVRLKYNQDSGEVFDEKIVRPAVWRWHNLNDPPTYVKRFADTYEKNPNPVLTEIINRNENTCEKKSADEMVKVSLENFAKQHHKKLEMHTIHIKKFSVNEFFWLSVIKQSKIILRFNDGFNMFELDLGMVIHPDCLLRKEYVVVSSEPVMNCDDHK